MRVMWVLIYIKHILFGWLGQAIQDYMNELVA